MDFQECPVCKEVAYWSETDKEFQCSSCGFSHNGSENEPKPNSN